MILIKHVVSGHAIKKYDTETHKIEFGERNSSFIVKLKDTNLVVFLGSLVNFYVEHKDKDTD